ncbi:MAG: TVP38/TMEM64 family protein [Planctomycetes bacterium]|nr:TVP38/TMEM64 family protein [Planctomycetota bacterium]
MGVTVFFLKLFAIVAVAGLCVCLYPYMNSHNIGEFVKKNSVAAPLVFILITAFRPVLVFLPSMGLTIVAGVLFGMVSGTLYVVIGGALSTLVGFYFARWLGKDAFAKIVRKSRYLMVLDKKARGYGGNAVLYMRLFNLPWDIVSYWAGLSGINFKDFYVASMIPIVPISFLYTYFGSKVFTPASPGFIISLTIMIIMGSIPYISARRQKNSNG